MISATLVHVASRYLRAICPFDLIFPFDVVFPCLSLCIYIWPSGSCSGILSHYPIISLLRVLLHIFLLSLSRHHLILFIGRTRIRVLSSPSFLRAGGMALAVTVPEEFLPQAYVQHVDMFIFFQTDILPKRLVSSLPVVDSGNRTVTINNLPGEILLEIFDHYGQSSNFYPRTWCTKNGWFKLVHVCHKWRCVVLASRHRLRLLLVFAESTPTRAAALESQSLSHLPIIVDYTKISWNPSARTRLASALRYRNRVVKISINGSPKDFDKVCETLDVSLPALGSLELHNMKDNIEYILQASSFMTSIRSLQHLRVVNMRQLSSFLPILSVTRALVILDLTVDELFHQSEGASLLTHLQCIPRLRYLRVFRQYHFSNSLEKPPITTVLLAELSDFYFSGKFIEIEWFVAGLITPSLRRLHISATIQPLQDTLDIPHLSKFIRVAGIIFSAARLSFVGLGLTTTMFSHLHSIDDRTRIITFRTLSSTHLGSAFSPMLATLEDIFLCFTMSFPFYRPLLQDLGYWRKFFEKLCNVKVLRLQHGLETEVADVLRQPAVDPSSPAQEEVDPGTTTPPGPTINYSGSIFALNIFPLLEKIVVHAKPSERSLGINEILFALEPFREYADARRRAGRPVGVQWSVNGGFPRCYTLKDIGS